MKNRLKLSLFDMDDTLCNMREPLARCLNEATGKDIHWTDFNKFDMFLSHYGLESDQAFKHMMDYGVIEQCKIEPHAKEVLQAFVDHGHQIDVVTSRGWHPRARQLTEDFIQTHNLPITNLRVLPQRMSKAEYLNANFNYNDRPISFFVDDNIDHVSAVANKCFVRFPTLVHRPWNNEERKLGRTKGLDPTSYMFDVEDLVQLHTLLRLVDSNNYMVRL